MAPIVVPAICGALQWGRSVNAAETTSWRQSCWSRTRCFNGAAALTLRKPPSRPEPPHGRRCFNGAAALTLRKPDDLDADHRRQPLLQWGRSVNAAETKLKTHSGSIISRFNGAAALTLRKPSRGRRIKPRFIRCFNGAAALTLRKPQLGANQLTGGVTLQWGRSVNAAETRREPPGIREDSRASMGPQR